MKQGLKKSPKYKIRERLKQVDPQLLSVLRNCRTVMEMYVDQIPVHQYRPDADELDCMCAISSQFITLQAAKAGIEVELVVGNFIQEKNGSKLPWDHCWVESQGLIFDITAKQFDRGLNPIHIDLVEASVYQASRRGIFAQNNIRQQWPTCQKMVKKVAKKLEKLESEFLKSQVLENYEKKNLLKF